MPPETSKIVANLIDQLFWPPPRGSAEYSIPVSGMGFQAKNTVFRRRKLSRDAKNTVFRHRKWIFKRRIHYSGVENRVGMQRIQYSGVKNEFLNEEYSILRLKIELGVPEYSILGLKIDFRSKNTVFLGSNRTRKHKYIIGYE